MKLRLVYSLQILSVYAMLSHGKRQRYCEAKKNWYYRESIKECYKCEKCVMGEGKINFEDANLPMHQEYGATQCIPCRPCKPDMYNDKRAFKCKHCRDCKQQGKYELQKCTTVQNAVCGDNIQDFSDGISKRPCTENSCHGNNTSNIVVEQKNSTFVRNRHISDSKAIIAVCGLMAIIVVLVILFVLFYTRKRKGCKKKTRHMCNNHNDCERQQLPLMVLGDRICNSRKLNKTKLPKKSNLRAVDSRSDNNQNQPLDSEETNLKLADIPVANVQNHSRTNLNNNSQCLLHNNSHCLRHQNKDNGCKNVYQHTDRLFGEINKACKENSGSSESSTIQRKDLEPVAPDTNGSHVSGSLLPFRSLSEFSYNFTAPSLDCCDNELSCLPGRHYNTTTLSSVV